MSLADDNQLERLLLETVTAAGSRGLSLRQLLRRLELGSERRRRVRRLLQGLVRRGALRSNGRGRYLAAGGPQEFEGTVRARGRGRLELVGNGAYGPVGITSENRGGALPGDRVRVRLLEGRNRGRWGVVEEILERARSRVVGTLHRRGRFLLLVPDAGGGDPLVVRPATARQLEDGTVVVARLDESNPWRAEVEQVLGQPGELACELRRLEAAHSLESEFPETVIAELETLEPAGTAGRADLRGLDHVTIDPADARDHDDAVYVESSGSGFRLVVSIADVAAHVAAGGALDGEALRRGCSTYLPGRVYHMLPARLAEKLCSLVPEAERPALSVEMEVDGQGRVRRSRFLRSLIRSRARLSYRQVQRHLDGSEPLADPVGPMLEQAAACARLLLSALQRRGMLELEVPELHIELDGAGRPQQVAPAERLFSHRLIEVFMVAANEQVARFMESNHLPALYRVHPAPDAEKLAAFARSAKLLGAPLELSQPPEPLELARFLESLRGRPALHTLSPLLLRSLMQAHYAAVCQPHFGLASEAYLHFTSPIRRYPDLWVHRLLGALLERAGERGLEAGARVSAPEDFPAAPEPEQVAEQCSAAERRALAAERQAQALYAAAFLEPRVGESFRGRVGFVTDFGLFVTLEPHGIEGLVHVSALGDDYYRYQPEQLSLVGRRSGRAFRPGQSLAVKLQGVRLFPPQVELVLA